MGVAAVPDSDEVLRHANCILAIGCPGGGKSTLARTLSASLDLPYLSMDRDFYWLPGWRKRDRCDIDRPISEVVAQERWILDGTGLGSFHLRLPRADLVIWLRLPRMVCLWRAISRVIRYRGRNRPEMPEGCRERLTLDMIGNIWNFERHAAPKIEAALHQLGPNVPVLQLKSRRQARELLDLLRAPA